MGKEVTCTISGIILILSVIGFLHPLLSVEGRPTGPMDPTIWTETEKDTYTLNVEPGHAEDITIYGTVYCEFAKGTPPGTKVYLDMEITSNVDFKGSVLHTFIKGQEEDPFDFSIDVPDMVGASSEFEYHMTMYPNWYNPTANRQGMGEPHTITIDPLPYGAVLIIAPGPQRFNVGEFHEVELEIKNRGNAQAKFDVTIDADGLELALPAMELNIGAGRVGVYSFGIKQDSGLGKVGYLEIEVSSEMPGEVDTDRVKVHYETYATAGQAILQPITLFISVPLLAALAVLTVLIVKRIRRTRFSI